MRAAINDNRWDIVGFVDIDSAVLAGLRNELHIPSKKIFSDPAVAIDTLRPDAITCSIPNPARLPLILKALHRGIDVLVDKPIVHTVDELKELLGAYAHSSSIVSVAENYRLFPQSQYIAERIRKGEMGKLGNIYVRFAKQTRFMGNKFYGRLPGWRAVGLEDVVHYVDLFRFFSGADPGTVFSWGWRHPWNWGAGYTAIQANLMMDNGVHAGYTGTWDSSVNLTPWEGEWLFELERGSFVWNRIEGMVEIYDAKGERTANYSPKGLHGPKKPPEILNAHTEDSVDYISEVSMDAVFEMFTSASLNGGIVHCPLEDNAFTMSATLALEESAETAKTVNCREFMESNGVADMLRNLDRGQ